MVDSRFSTLIKSRPGNRCAFRIYHLTITELSRTYHFVHLMNCCCHCNTAELHASVVSKILKKYEIRDEVVVWRSGITFHPINEVTLCWARLVL